MQILIYPLIRVIGIAIELYIFALIAMAVLSWLLAFGILNTRSPFVYRAIDFLSRITEPALRPIRRILPNFGGIDISPIILILLLYYLQNVLAELPGYLFSR